MKKETQSPQLPQTAVSGSFLDLLLKKQKESCLKEYMAYYAGSREDFAPDCIIESILNAPIPEVKKLLIDFEDWHYQCGDKCCDMYGTDIYLNGEKLDEQYAEDSSNALKVVLEKLGYKVELNYR